MDKSLLRLYFICGTENVEGKPLNVIEEALAGGVTMFQLREKGPGGLSGDDLSAFASEIKQLCTEYNVPFIINDDAVLAEKIGADGVHLGQNDQDITTLTSYFDDKIVGLSVGNEREFDQSSIQKADYIGTGPVFSTPSKDDAGDVIGAQGLAAMRERIGDLPMVAVGGITHDNYTICLESGADGVSVVSAIAGASDVKQAVNMFF